MSTNNAINTPQITLGGAFTMTGGAFTFAGTLTGNTAVTFPTSGTLATTGQTFLYSNVTGTTQAMSINTGYISNNVGLVTLTLPSSASVGSIVAVVGSGAGGWTIAQNASGVIHVGSSASTTGVGGSVSSSNRYDSIYLVCIVANNEWSVLGMQGNPTIV